MMTTPSLEALSPIEQKMLLLQLPDVGVATYWKLVEYFGDLPNFFASTYSEAREHLANLVPKPAAEVLRDLLTLRLAHPAYEKVQSDLQWLEARGIRTLDIESASYPILLKEVRRAPPLLYIWGNQELLHLPQIAIVGSRQPTKGGENHAFDFARGLAKAGFVITSGLALGVDVTAHEGALAGGGQTLAVLGTSIDKIYPARHVSMAENIVTQGGAVISEFPLRTGALRSNFPQRNRIISGLSCGVLVVEAAIKSGSLITARYALQQNREVFAIPGSIQNPLARGCHALIREGATLVESSADIVQQLEGMLAFKREEARPNIQHQLIFDNTKPPLVSHSKAASTQKIRRAKPQESPGIAVTENPAELKVLACLSYEPLSFDELSEQSQIHTGDLMACLLTMELKGLVENLGYGYILVTAYTGQ